MKIYVIKRPSNFGEFEDPVRYQTTSFVFTTKVDADHLVEELNNVFPDCKGSWSLPFFAEEVDLLEDYTLVSDRLRCSSCNGTGKYPGSTSNFPCSFCDGRGIKVF